MVWREDPTPSAELVELIDSHQESARAQQYLARLRPSGLVAKAIDRLKNLDVIKNHTVNATAVLRAVGDIQDTRKIGYYLGIATTREQQMSAITSLGGVSIINTQGCLQIYVSHSTILPPDLEEFKAAVRLELTTYPDPSIYDRIMLRACAANSTEFEQALAARAVYNVSIKIALLVLLYLDELHLQYLNAHT